MPTQLTEMPACYVGVVVVDVVDFVVVSGGEDDGEWVRV